MKKWIVVGLALLSLAACAPYPYYYHDGYYRDGYYRDGYYRDGYYGRPYDRGYYSDRDGYYRDDGRYYGDR